MTPTRTAYAADLMSRFAARTGLVGDAPVRRYLWTDAFAVCNLLGLRVATGNARFEELALRLVDQVHHELGRHRADDPRSGWLSGLPDAEAAAHPTRAGLRIGKSAPERAPNHPFEPALEWDRDGQYFHYLTKWMHALDQVSRATGRPEFNLWARELAVAAHRAFTYGPPERRRMVWKLSIDLTRPLVPSMGQHDPLDGLVTCTQLAATARTLASAQGPSLAREITDFERMLDHAALATLDPLGIGGLLVDASRLAQVAPERQELVGSLIAAAVRGLRDYLAQPDLRLPAEARLAFRELGMAIGLAAVPLLENALHHPPSQQRLDAARTPKATSAGATATPSSASTTMLAELTCYTPLRTEIEAFWLEPDHRRTVTWGEHADINDVMLATSLLPDGFLTLAPLTATPRVELRR